MRVPSSRSRAAALSVLVAVVTALVGTVPDGAYAAAMCAPPRCIDIEVPVPPDVYVPDRHVRVLLPKGYDDSCRRYPVLYLLHGVGDTYTSWMEKGDADVITADADVIVVMPDAGKTPNAGWYSDWKDPIQPGGPKPRWETFHVDYVVPYIDRNLRTLGEGHRAAAGVSMGGFGAMSYAFRHRGLFQAALSFSGVLDTRALAPATAVGFQLASSQFGTPDSRIWGGPSDQVMHDGEWAAHNPTDHAVELSTVPFLFWSSGTGTPGTVPAEEDPANPGLYFEESLFLLDNASFARALTLAGVEYSFHVYPGRHNWIYWQRELKAQLRAILDTVGPAVPGRGNGTSSLGAPGQAVRRCPDAK